MALSGLSVVGTQHASSVWLGGKQYVWGGTNGLTGFSTPPAAQQWFSIVLSTGVVAAESQSCGTPCDWPGSLVWVSPVLFTSSAGRYIYLYSGLQADYATWSDNFDVFIYDTANGGSWLEDVEPVVSPFSQLTPQFPNMVTALTAGRQTLRQRCSGSDPPRPPLPVPVPCVRPLVAWLCPVTATTCWWWAGRGATRA